MQKKLQGLYVVLKKVQFALLGKIAGNILFFLLNS